MSRGPDDRMHVGVRILPWASLLPTSGASRSVYPNPFVAGSRAHADIRGTDQMPMQSRVQTLRCQMRAGCPRTLIPGGRNVAEASARGE
jgi:hypothetical protein